MSNEWNELLLGLTGATKKTAYMTPNVTAEPWNHSEDVLWLAAVCVWCLNLLAFTTYTTYAFVHYAVGIKRNQASVCRLLYKRCSLPLHLTVLIPRPSKYLKERASSFNLDLFFLQLMWKLWTEIRGHPQNKADMFSPSYCMAQTFDIHTDKVLHWNIKTLVNVCTGSSRDVSPHSYVLPPTVNVTLCKICLTS